MRWCILVHFFSLLFLMLYTCIHTYIHIHIYTYTYIDMYVCVCVLIFLHFQCCEISFWLRYTFSFQYLFPLGSELERRGTTWRAIYTEALLLRRPSRISISHYRKRRLRVAKPRSAFILRNGFSDKVSLRRSAFGSV